VTVDGTRHVCRAAARSNVRRLVYLSTNDVFGRGEQAVIDESFPLKPWKEPYPDHKIRAEEIVWLYHREQRLPVSTIYPCWVYGENDYTLTADLADAIIKRQMLFWRRGAFVFPLYVGNLVELMLIVAEDDRAVGHGFLAHDGGPITLEAYADAVAKALSVPPVSRRLPYPAVYLAAAALEKTWRLLRRKKRPLLTTYVVRSLGSKARYSIKKAERELGWRPGISFDEGLMRTLAWLKTVDRNRLKTK
jgi:2-alkyl-3-oxoalkanoate reductase